MLKDMGEDTEVQHSVSRSFRKRKEKKKKTTEGKKLNRKKIS